MQYPTQDPVMITMMKAFQNDPSVVVLDRLPFFDDYKKRRQIDYALITRSDNPVAIAILVKPKTSSDNYDDLNRSVNILEELKWITFVFTENELLCDFDKVKSQLMNVLKGTPCK